MSFKVREIVKYPKSLVHPDIAALRAYCQAREKGGVPTKQVRQDSPEWQAWSRWYRERGLPTAWSDALPPERMMTVPEDFPFPPEDVSGLATVSAKKLELKS